MKHSILVRLVLTICVLVSLFRVSVASAATPEQVEATINRAKDWLYKQQNAAGNWEVVPAPVAGENASSVKGPQFGGLTAIATYALLASGESYQDPRLAKAIAFLKQTSMTGTYAVGLQAQIWPFLPLTDEVKACVKRDAIYLSQAVLDAKKKNAGLYSYIGGALGGYDHSNSQYGVLGLWACAEVDLELPDSFWQIIENAWRAHQLPGGGWCYQNAAANPLHSTEKPSMTAAGIATLFITQDFLHSNDGIDCKGNIQDAALDKGLKWMSDHFADPAMHGLYTLYGIERIGVASGHKYFGTVDWYKDGAEFLVRHQTPGGNWAEHGGVPATAWGILFLCRGRAPVIINKLQYDLVQKGQPSVGNWNQRPRECAHFAKWMGKQLERFLNWQIVNLRVNVDDLHDAPILYISGNQELTFSDADQHNLKKFVEQGGIILGNADCGSSIFTSSFQKLGVKLFPKYEFRELPVNHPIFTCEQFQRNQMKSPPRIIALGNMAREFMILIPQADPGRAWQMQASTTKPELFQIGDNILLYAVDKQNLRNKGENYIVQPNPAVHPPRTLRLARIMEGANPDPEPGGWRRFAALLHNQNVCEFQADPIKLGAGALAKYQIAHFTGTTRFQLNPAQQAELAKFIQSGGTLILDACGGSNDFANSAEALLKAIAPQQATQLEQPLEESHAFYTGMKLDDLTYRLFARKQLLGQVKGPRLRAASIDGRLRIFYSHEDLSVGLVGQPVDGIFGYEPKAATSLMTRIINYAAKNSAVAKHPAKDAGPVE